MNTKLNNAIAKMAVVAMDVQKNPMVLVKALERGDADSSGSTLRTVGIVTLVIAVVILIGAAVMGAGGRAVTRLGTNFVF